ncbi:hypothetical protein B296_00015730 [Ensete ventricosum]|uniref:Retrotransposon gag domain-containing protein n=1 Tax=Ensete ventricosum TaxID=4639 RepID=A0A426ZTV8_ENSVE|nr:hypothetical protein B296_00015730 [Ensete ventricosum]
MSQERPTPINPGEDVPPATQPTSRGALQPPLSLPSWGDGNLSSHTLGQIRPPWASRPVPTPRASVRSLPDPDTLSSDSTDSLREQLRLVNQRIDNVRKTLKTNDERGESPLRGSPFIQEIQDAPIPPHFRLPMLEAYDDNSDPMKHIATFQPTTASLLGMRQKEDEHLSWYLAHFTEEIRVIPDAHPSLVIQAFMIEIRPSCLFWSLVERPLATMPEMLQRAYQYITVEILVAEKYEDQKRPRAEPSRGPPPGLPRKRTKRTEQTIPRSPNIPLKLRFSSRFKRNDSSKPPT